MPIIKAFISLPSLLSEGASLRQSSVSCLILSPCSIDKAKVLTPCSCSKYVCQCWVKSGSARSLLFNTLIQGLLPLSLAKKWILAAERYPRIKDFYRDIDVGERFFYFSPGFVHVAGIPLDGHGLSGILVKGFNVILSFLRFRIRYRLQIERGFSGIGTASVRIWVSHRYLSLF